MRARFATGLCCLLLLAAVSLFFWPALWQGRSLVPSDLLNQFVAPYNASVPVTGVQNHYAMDILQQDVPWNTFLAASFQRGEAALWNPNVLGGYPHAAGSMEAAFSPFKLLYTVLPVERAFSLGVVLQFALVAIAMFAFLRVLDRSRPAAVCGALAFGLNSALLVWYWRIPGVYAWAPLALLGFEWSLRQRHFAAAGLGGLAFGLGILSGNIQAAVHLLILCGTYMAGRFIWPQATTRSRVVAHAALVLGLGGLVAAVQWLPTLELMLHEATGRMGQAGPRPGLQHTLLGLPALITFVFPALAGSTETYDVLKIAGASLMFFTGYIGVVPCALFLTAAQEWRDPRLRPWLGMIIVTLIIVFATPLVRPLYHRVFIVMVFAMAVLSAFGFDALMEGGPVNQRAVRRAFWLMGGLGLALAVGLVIVQLVVAWKGDVLEQHAREIVAARSGDSLFAQHQDWMARRVPAFLQHYRLSNPVFAAPLGCLALGGVLVAAGRRSRLTTGVVAAGLLVVTATDLILVGRPRVPQVDLTRYPLFPELPALEPVLAETGLFRITVAAPQTSLFLPPNMAMVYGLASLDGFESIQARTLAQQPMQTSGQFNRWLDVANVRFVVTPPGVELSPPRFTKVSQGLGLQVYQNETCLPRARFLTDWEAVTVDSEVVSRTAAETFDPVSQLLVELPRGISGPASGAGAISPQEGESSVTVTVYEPRRCSFDVQAANAGWLVIADNWYPGWSASVDGAPAQVRRANGVLRAIALSNGAHRVQLWYRPPSFIIGMVLSLLGVLTAVGSGVALVRQRQWRTGNVYKTGEPH